MRVEVLIGTWVAGAVPALALALLAVRRRYDFAVVVARDGAVTFKGRFRPGGRAETIDFFGSAFAPRGPLTVYGNWRAGRRELKLRFRGVPADRQQVVRNFFMTTLRP
jgi:hypothetical protein